MTTRYIKICACQKQLFRVGRISLRVREYTQVVKQRICFCYYIKTCSSWCFFISTLVKCDLLRVFITLRKANLLSKRSKLRRHPSPIAEKVYFILLFAHFVLVHVIKRISNEFSFHMMYYETRCVFYIPSPEARGYKTHNSFHNTSYGMKIHLRSYIYC